MRQAFQIAEFALSCRHLPAAAQREAIYDGEMLQLKTQMKKKMGDGRSEQGKCIQS